LASGGCSFAGPDCKQKEVFCIGFVTQVGRLDDSASNQAAWETIQQAKSDGFADKTGIIETIDSRDYETNVRVFAEAGYDVIVTVGNDAEAATYSIAGLFPKVYFIGADQQPSLDKVNLPNLVWLVFPEDHMGFLAGALAAAMTQTGKVGAVLGSEALPQMKLYGDGFLAGVTYISPEINATAAYHNEVDLPASINDPAWGVDAANSLIDEGADIIFAAGGTTATGALEDGASRGIYVIGAEIDQYAALPSAAPFIIASAMKLIEPGISDLIKAARDSAINHSPFRTGIYYGQVGFSPWHELSVSVPDEVKQQMKFISQALLLGEIQPNELTPSP
jgi:basic membrane protein A and related proteins